MKTPSYTLKLSNKGIADEQLCQLLSEFVKITYLERLDLSHNLITDKCVPQLLRFIQQNPNLKSIDLTGNRLTDSVVSSFSELTIREIHFDINQITAAGISSFFNSKSIFTLSYDRQREIESCNDTAHKISQVINKNLVQYQMALVETYITLSCGFRQQENILKKLPKSLFVMLLIEISSDFEYANLYTSNIALIVSKSIDYIIDVLMNKKLNSKHFTHNKKMTFFKEACSLLAVQPKQEDTNRSTRKNEKCNVM